MILQTYAEEVTGRERPLAADVDLDVVGDYRGYAEQVARWAELERRGLRARVVGESVGGRPLWALEAGPADAPRVSALLAGIHALEWIGVETGAALLERLAAEPPRDRRVIAFPLVNVDGYRRAEADLRAGRRRFVRTNARGVDLNRNWPVHHRARPPSLPARLLGASGGGPAPLSEPEVRAIAGVLEEAAAGGAAVDVALSLHSIGEKVLMPWGGRWRAPDDAGRLRRAAARVRERLGGGYKALQTSHWVPGALVRGMELDFLHARFGAVALLVELSWGGASPGRPGSLIHPFRWYNPAHPGPIAAGAAAALEPFVRGCYID
ncbi:MAG TPA: M14 family metallopeptidase [Kofleriaceae bacterium]|nr:M14 family metallopeptidase [Kofleriaceae bacterium]